MYMYENVCVHVCAYVHVCMHVCVCVGVVCVHVCTLHKIRAIVIHSWCPQLGRGKSLQCVVCMLETREGGSVCTRLKTRGLVVSS